MSRVSPQQRREPDRPERWGRSAQGRRRGRPPIATSRHLGALIALADHVGLLRARSCSRTTGQMALRLAGRARLDRVRSTTSISASEAGRSGQCGKLPAGEWRNGRRAGLRSRCRVSDVEVRPLSRLPQAVLAVPPRSGGAAERRQTLGRARDPRRQERPAFRRAAAHGCGAAARRKRADSDRASARRSGVRCASRSGVGR